MTNRLFILWIIRAKKSANTEGVPFCLSFEKYTVFASFINAVPLTFTVFLFGIIGLLANRYLILT